MTRPLRVLHVIKGLGRGGAERLLVDGYAAADPGRVTLSYGYFLPWKDAFVPELRGLGAEVTCYEAPTAAAILGAAATLARHVRRWRADLVHAHLPLAGVAARLAGALCRVPVVYTEHNLQERYHPLTRRANLATWRLQAHALAVSAEVAASAERHAGRRVPLQVVTNGVPLERFAPRPVEGAAVRARLGIAPEAPVVGTVVVFRPQKRLDLWLEAASAIRRELPSARFLIVGDGPARAELERRRRDLDLTDTVHLVGLQEDVRPYLAAMDVYLMSSDFEGLPIALLEAMAMGLPPVVTSVGGVPEVVSTDCGLLVGPGDPLALARATLGLLRDPGPRESLGRAARRRVEERFGTSRMQAELCEVYERVAAGRGRG